MMMFVPSLEVMVFFVCVLKWSLLGVQKRLGHTQIGLRGLIQNFSQASAPRPFHMEAQT